MKIGSFFSQRGDLALFRLFLLRANVKNFVGIS